MDQNGLCRGQNKQTTVLYLKSILKKQESGLRILCKSGIS